MTILDLIVLAVLVYFIVSRFTDQPMKKTGPKKKRTPIEIKVMKGNTQSKEQIEQIFQKAREMSEKVEADKAYKDGLVGLEKVKAFDAEFSEKKFLSGAKKAYKWYYDCLNKDEESELENLLAPRIYSQVVDHLDSLDDGNMQELVEVVKLDSPTILDCKTVAKSAFIDVKYKAELLIKTINKETKEEETKTENREVVWTWARNIISTDPNWQLDEIKNVS